MSAAVETPSASHSCSNAGHEARDRVEHHVGGINGEREREAMHALSDGLMHAPWIAGGEPVPTAVRGARSMRSWRVRRAGRARQAPAFRRGRHRARTARPTQRGPAPSRRCGRRSVPSGRVRRPGPASTVRRACCRYAAWPTRCEAPLAEAWSGRGFPLLQRGRRGDQRDPLPDWAIQHLHRSASRSRVPSKPTRAQLGWLARFCASGCGRPGRLAQPRRRS